MKIVVLEGSPNKNGSSNMLAKEFIRGAQEAHYETLLRYLNLTDMGRVWGRGCGTPSMTKWGKTCGKRIKRFLHQILGR